MDNSNRSNFREDISNNLNKDKSNTLMIKDFPEQEKPRERLIKTSPSALSNSELLALILEKGIKEKNVIELSKEILSKYSVDELGRQNLNSLREIEGIGLAKACQIVACFELGRRASSYTKEFFPQITCAEDVYELLSEKLRFEKKEHFIGLFLDTRKRLIKEEIIFIGTLDSSIIHPREIIKSAVKESASSIIVVHNHPSGDPTPSEEDLAVTRQLIKACEIMGIPLLDHVIIGDKKFESLRKIKEIEFN